MIMKQAKRLTRQYKEAVAAYGLNPENWMLQKDGDVYITIIHKITGSVKRIDKYAREVKRRAAKR